MRMFVSHSCFVFSFNLFPDQELQRKKNSRLANSGTFIEMLTNGQCLCQIN